MDLIFAILLAGCADDGMHCTPLDRFEVTVESRAECEVLLDAAMAAEDAPWPVYRGICLSAEEVAAGAPDWWQDSGRLMAAQ